MNKDIKGNEIGPGDTCALVHRMSREWKGKKIITPPQVVLVRLGGLEEGDCCSIFYKKCLSGPEPGEQNTASLADVCTTDALLKIPDNIKDDASILGFIKLSGYFTDEG